MTDRFTGYGFADYFMEQKRHINTFLDKIDKPIDFLRKGYRRVRSS